MDQNRMIAELIARGYDADELQSKGLDELSQLHKKEFPDKYTVSDDAIQNQDFSKDPETNANLYKIGDGPGIFKPAARRNFEGMQEYSKNARAANGNNDPTTKVDVDKWAIEKIKPVGGKPAEGAGNLPSISDTLPDNNKVAEVNIDGSDNPTGADTGSDGNSNTGNNVGTPSSNKVANYARRSIYDAWKNGEFGDPDSEEAKNTRNYFIMDVLGNFAKDLGAGQMSIANIYANGGNVQPAQQSKSQWDKTQDEMLASQIESRKSGIVGSREQRERDMADAQIYAQKLNNLSMADRRAMAQTIRKYIDSAPNDTLRLAYANIYNSMLTDGGVSDRDLGVIAGTEGFNWLKGKLGL